jgi:uncharacterized protein YukE
MTLHEVKPSPVPAGAGPLTAPEIAAILTRLDPAALAVAGAAHTRLGEELGAVAAHLAQEASTLTAHWSGAAADAALAQFQRLHRQAATLAAQASQTGAALTWLGTQLRPAFQHPADPAQARAYLTQLTTDLVRADASLPDHLGTADSQGPGGTPIHPTTPAQSTTLTQTTSTTTPRSPVSRLQAVTPTPAPTPEAATPASGPAPLAAPAPSPMPGPVLLAGAPPRQPTTSDPAITTSDVEGMPATTPVAPALAEDAGVTPIPLLSARTSSTSRTSDSREDEAQPAPLAHTAASLTPGVTTPPAQDRHRQSWIPEDLNLWGLPDTCVPALIEGP